MPKMDGEELLKKLRKKRSLPVIFLTSKDEEVDELLGLKLGADDFVKKSGGFSIKVLIERIRVQLRKKNINIEDTKNIINHGKLKLDPSQLECEWGGKQLPDKLTTTEFLIVQELAKRPGIIKERAQLMDIAYREDTDIEDRTIDSHVKRIRKKFKKVIGHGLNKQELEKNKIFDSFWIQNLNLSQQIPLDKESVDYCLMVAAWQYLQYPENLTKEIARILSRKGKFIIAFSNRAFWHKAPKIWTSSTEEERVKYVRKVLISNGFNEPKIIKKFTEPALNIFNFLNKDPFYCLIATRE